MGDGIEVELGPAQETLLVPLFGRAELTRQGIPLIDDPKAVEIVEHLDYDFSPFVGTMSLVGSVLRTRIHDHWVERWLAEHPDGTVVEIGVGLNTRYERLNNGRARWLELDLPDVMDLRRRFFAETERRRMLTASLTDDSWLTEATGRGGPWFLAVEAVLIYLDDAEVQRFFERVAATFPNSQVSFDTWSTWIRDHADEHDTIGSLAAEFTWFCDDLATVAGWDPRISVLDSRTFVDAPPELVALLPPELQQMLPLLADDPQMRAYRQHLVEIAA